MHIKFIDFFLAAFIIYFSHSILALQDILENSLFIICCDNTSIPCYSTRTMGFLGAIVTLAPFFDNVKYTSEAKSQKNKQVLFLIFLYSVCTSDCKEQCRV